VPELSVPGGSIAIAVVWLLIFVEEAGVPLPPFPGDGLLLVAGVMIAAGQVSPWLFFPVAFASAMGGAMTGYAWSRHLDRASDRLQRTGAIGVMVGRLLPGTRVYTSLVAGASGMRPATFARGLAASSLVWLGVFTGLGILVGVPAMHYLSQIQAIWLTLLAQVGLLVLVGVCLRWLRPPVTVARARQSRAARMVAAAGLDLLLAGLIGVAFHWLRVPAAVPSYMTLAHLVFGTTSAVLAYVGLARLLFGTTAGERVAQVSYRELMAVFGRAGGRPPNPPGPPEGRADRVVRPGPASATAAQGHVN
jgi:membrane protein DedA with SNARE-associated domain